MQNRLAADRESWHPVSAQYLEDILGYAQYAENAVPDLSFRLPLPSTGKPVFEAKCAGCHQGRLSLTNLLQNLSLMDLGASMWNHAPQMSDVPVVSATAMSQILSYVWELQFIEQPGEPLMERSVFEGSQCIACHSDPAPERVPIRVQASGSRRFPWSPLHVDRDA